MRLKPRKRIHGGWLVPLRTLVFALLLTPIVAACDAALPTTTSTTTATTAIPGAEFGTLSAGYFSAQVPDDMQSSVSTTPATRPNGWTEAPMMVNGVVYTVRAYVGGGLHQLTEIRERSGQLVYRARNEWTYSYGGWKLTAIYADNYSGGGWIGSIEAVPSDSPPPRQGGGDDGTLLSFDPPIVGPGDLEYTPNPWIRRGSRGLGGYWRCRGEWGDFIAHGLVVIGAIGALAATAPESAAAAAAAPPVAAFVAAGVVGASWHMFRAQGQVVRCMKDPNF